MLFIRLLSVSSLCLFGFSVLAQSNRPVSVSYEKIVKCFPELKSEELSFKVDLNKFKDLADEKFVTAQSQLRQRKVEFTDSEGKNLILLLVTDYEHSKKLSTEMSLKSVDEKGVQTEVLLTQNQRINPKQEIINSFLINSSIKNDEYTYVDTKLNDVKATYRKSFKDVVEYKIEELSGNRSVSCENQKDLGIICTCTKK